MTLASLYLNTASSTPTNTGALAVAVLFILFVGLVVGAVMVVSMWKLFEKAGRPGWHAIVPFYNMYSLTQVAGCPPWFFWGWVGGFLISALTGGLGGILAFVMIVLIYIRVGAAFGRTGGFTIGLILLPVIFFPILAFGPARYLGSGMAMGGGFGGGGLGGAVNNPYGQQTSGDGWGPPAQGGGFGAAGAGDVGLAAGAQGGYGAGGFGAPTGPTPPSAPTGQAPGWYPVDGDQMVQAWWDGSSWSNRQRWNGSAWVAE